MNGARAGMAADPADYRFGSWGQWCATGRHPFGENLRNRLQDFEHGGTSFRCLADLQKRLRIELARLSAIDSGMCPEQTEAAMKRVAKPPDFLLRADRRVRYWTDGLIIGGKAFVREMAARVWCSDHVRRHRLQPASGPGAENLYAYRRLHSLPG